MFKIQKVAGYLYKNVRPRVALQPQNRNYVQSVYLQQFCKWNSDDASAKARNLGRSEKVAGVTFSAKYSGSCKGTDNPDPTTGLTPKEVKLIKSTWSRIMKDPKENGVTLLSLWLRAHPDYIKYFPFKDIPLKDLPKTPTFQAHAVNVMYALHAIIDNLDKPELVMSLLKKNGESHAKRNIPVKTYLHIKDAMLKTLSKGLGKYLTPEGKAAWDKLLTNAIKVIGKTLNKHGKS